MTDFSPIEILSLYRYPVKGLSPQRLASVRLEPGKTLPWDRAYAIENGPGRFDPDNPKHLPKINFLMLMRNERLAALRTEFDDETQTLTINRDGRQIAKGALGSKLGRQLIEQFLAGYMKDELKGPPRIVSAPGHSFSDVAAKCLHLVNLATIREVEGVIGRPLDPTRFRANVFFDGAEPWAEKKWLGRSLRIGEARLKVFAETNRCEATNVNPETAERDTAIPPTLLRTYGHTAVGVYATVATGGEVRPGDRIEILD
ncbi:MAG TPA: MOSC domain-containing protein [Hyphomicrobiales bacterium]|jgi:uncharacterized protein YcbX